MRPASSPGSTHRHWLAAERTSRLLTRIIRVGREFGRMGQVRRLHRLLERMQRVLVEVRNTPVLVLDHQRPVAAGILGGDAEGAVMSQSIRFSTGIALQFLQVRSQAGASKGRKSAFSSCRLRYCCLLAPSNCFRFQPIVGRLAGCEPARVFDVRLRPVYREGNPAPRRRTC